MHFLEWIYEYEQFNISFKRPLPLGVNSYDNAHYAVQKSTSQSYDQSLFNVALCLSIWKSLFYLFVTGHHAVKFHKPPLYAYLEHVLKMLLK